MLGGHEIVALAGKEFEATLFLLVLLNGQRIDGAEFVERRPQLRGFRAQQVGLDIQFLEAGQQVFQRAAPFGFQSLTNGFPTS